MVCPASRVVAHALRIAIVLALALAGLAVTVYNVVPTERPSVPAFIGGAIAVGMSGLVGVALVAAGIRCARASGARR